MGNIGGAIFNKDGILTSSVPARYGYSATEVKLDVTANIAGGVGIATRVNGYTAITRTIWSGRRGLDPLGYPSSSVLDTYR